MDIKKYCYDGSKKFNINKVSRSETSLCKKKAEALEKIKKNEKEIVELQEKLYAEKKEGVIFLFQAMDAAGKDGTINATLSCLSTHGVYEAAFKSPSSVEQGHDYLWRVHKECPAKGEIAIFNRSHYEEVLIYTVKSLFKSQARADRLEEKDLMPNRYKDINNFESYLYNNSIRVVKIFLNVSKEEQAKRFLSRIEELEKNWKFSESDYSERQYWDAYQEAFENAINETSTKIAPWYVVPADHKWYMRLVVSEIILATLKKMDPHYPEVSEDRKNTFLEIKAKLEEEIK
ncbi:MAG: polyphosphate kinase 2 family protein [Erysipelotrichaceae bacterium]|nr:polyphosphate kinase 2 family protein [Erysipelotrichaceae bacterium]